ncbi:MAG: NigD-like N-terminal domain-containing protein, partial [Dysgonamonadaceae bacterium]
MLTTNNNPFPFYLLLFLISLSLLQSCEKEGKRLDDYWVNFATVVKSNTEVTFQLDNNKVLIPKELKDYKGDIGQRVLLNYSFLRGDTIKVNSVSNILTGNIKLTGYPEQQFTDPVNIQS